MAPPAGKAFSPRGVNDYWISQRSTSKELSRQLSPVAEIKWAVIPSNSACGRVYVSIATFRARTT